MHKEKAKREKRIERKKADKARYHKRFLMGKRGQK